MTKLVWVIKTWKANVALNALFSPAKNITSQKEEQMKIQVYPAKKRATFAFVLSWKAV